MQSVNKTVRYGNQHISQHQHAAEKAIASANMLIVTHSHHREESTVQLKD